MRAILVDGVTSRKHPLYYRWRGMLNRCHNPAGVAYPNYGGRGITVCDRWRRSFADYAADIGLPPFRGAELDRVDNDGNYEPSNVRWVNWLANMRNRSVPLKHYTERDDLPERVRNQGWFDLGSDWDLFDTAAALTLSDLVDAFGPVRRFDDRALDWRIRFVERAA